MSKILKNQTGSSIFIADTGATLPASPGTYTIPPQDYLLWSASSNIVTQVGNGNVKVNDGSSDLSISAGMDLIKGNFPTKIVSEFNSPLVDACGRLRVSEPENIFESTFRYDLNATSFSTLSASGGSVAHNANTVSADLAVTTTTNSSAIIQSRRYMRYSPGRSQLVRVTGSFIESKANVVKRIGLFDSNNGVFFELNGTTLYVVYRSKVSGSVVDTKVAQSAWTGDKLDGTGASGITLDITKQQLFFIDFTWLGSGRVAFGFDLNGITVICHQIVFANILSVPYSQTGSLPIRAEMTNSGSNASTMRFTCSVVTSEGLISNNSCLFQTVNTGTSFRAVGGTTSVPILALRKKSTYLDMVLAINELITYCDTPDSLLVEVYFNPTLTGASWVTTASGRCEYDISATAYSGGLLGYSNMLKGGTSNSGISTANTNNLNSQFFLGSDLSGVSDIMLVTMRSTSGAANVSAAINYLENL